MTSTSSTRKRTAGQYTELHFADGIGSSVKSVRTDLLRILCSLRDGSATVTYNGQMATAVPADFLRLLTEWATASGSQHAVKNIVVSSLFSAEEKCAGAGLIAAGLWSSGQQSIAPPRGSRCTYENAAACLDYVGGNGMARATAEAVLQQGGMGCPVEYKESHTAMTRVMAHSGKQFVGEVDPLFGDRVGRNFDLPGCTVVAVDGFVESVAALHTLLESSATRPVVVLAKHFLPDVSNTAAETWVANRGKFLPFVVKEWGAGNFLDLESQGILCISQERGDMFSKLRLESCRPLNVTFQSQACCISGSDHDVVSKLTVEISQSLGGLTGLAKDRTKTLVGYARQCARSGVTRWKDFSEASRSFSELYSNGLAISSQSLVSGSRAAASLQKILQELGCVIQMTQGEKE